MPKLSLKEIKESESKSKSGEILRENLSQLIDNKKIHAVALTEPLQENECAIEIGPRLKSAYDAGQLPATHRVLYDSIVNELNGAREGLIKIQHLLSQTRISRNAAAVILKCLSHYGYLEYVVQKRRSEGTYIKLLI